MDYELRGLQIELLGYGPPGYQWAVIAITKACDVSDVEGSLRISVLIPNDHAQFLAEMESAAFEEAKQAIRQLLAALESDSLNGLKEKQMKRGTVEGLVVKLRGRNSIQV